MSDYGNSMNFSHSLTSDDSDSEHTPAGGGGGGGAPATRQLTASRVQLQSAAAAATEGSASAGRKPRGRPPGSKNKPKPPVVITRESESAMKPAVLEISAGSDVIEAVTAFATRRRVGLTLLSGSGTVSNVTLRHPMSPAAAAAHHGHGPPPPGSLISLHGPFHLLSLWGSFMGFNTKGSAASAVEHGFGITLSGAQGQVFGGVVGGKVVAAGPVVVVAATFLNPPFHRLPPPPSEDREGGSGADEDEEQHLVKKRCEVGYGGGEIVCAAVPLNNNY